MIKRTSEMLQQVKALAEQAWPPEFDLGNLY